jgi:hypothetical protein
MRLGGLHGRSGRVWKISSSPGFDPRIVQPVASRNTDWATRPTKIIWVLVLNTFSIQSFSADFHWSFFYSKHSPEFVTAVSTDVADNTNNTNHSYVGWYLHCFMLSKSSVINAVVSVIDVGGYQGQKEWYRAVVRILWPSIFPQGNVLSFFSRYFLRSVIYHILSICSPKLWNFHETDWYTNEDRRHRKLYVWVF